MTHRVFERALENCNIISNMAELQPKIVTRAFIQDNEGRILLGRRARGHGVGQFALVGGKPDAGESNDRAIEREVFEELGLKFIPVFYSAVRDTHFDSLYPWEVYYYTGEVTGNLNPKTDEITEVIYVGQSDLDNVDIAFDHRDRLREFFIAMKKPL